MEVEISKYSTNDVGRIFVVHCCPKGSITALIWWLRQGHGGESRRDRRLSVNKWLR